MPHSPLSPIIQPSLFTPQSPRSRSRSQSLSRSRSRPTTPSVPNTPQTPYYSQSYPLLPPKSPSPNPNSSPSAVYNNNNNNGYVSNPQFPTQVPTSTPEPARSSRFSAHSNTEAEAGTNDSTLNASITSANASGLSSLSYLAKEATYSNDVVDEEGFSKRSRSRGQRANPNIQADDNPSNKRSKIAYACLILLAIALILGAYFGSNTHHLSESLHASPDPSSPFPSPTSTHGGAGKIVYGYSGTQVTTEDGNAFIYGNPFGGYFAVDEEGQDPFVMDARAQSWVPALNQSWVWGRDRVFGVNLGGWLVLEPFITPSLYQKYPAAVDEWTLHTLMAQDTSPGGGLGQLEEHYKTFITEEDFAQIASAGLSWVRLPIPFWAIDTWSGEPFLAHTCWKYALKAFDWARKYGIRVALDLHTVPGGQNGYNHSGRSGAVNFLNGVMGIANAQRHLHYIRIFTEFISQPQYKDLILILGIVNEPVGMPVDVLNNFYIEAYHIIRNITGVGEGQGPFISIQGGNPNLSTFTGADRIALEQHPYLAFDGKGSEDITPYIKVPCQRWGHLINGTQKSFGVTFAGEFSLGFNDCGLMFHSTADEHTTKNCTQWDHWENYTPTQKADLKSFAMSSMDVLEDWFFWTWKIGPSATDNSPRSPFWSYKLGLDNGWIPQDPREASGHCASLGITPDLPFDGVYAPYQTGGPGADGTIAAADLAKYGQWPPPSVGLVTNAAMLPTYTATGPVPTLPTQTYAAPTAGPTVDGGNGWADKADTALGMVPVAGCLYPNAWDATAVVVPTALCTGQ